MVGLPLSPDMPTHNKVQKAMRGAGLVLLITATAGGAFIGPGVLRSRRVAPAALQGLQMQGRIAISGGTGNNWGTQLGVQVAQELRKIGTEPLLIEPRLRMAAEAPIVCSVER